MFKLRWYLLFGFFAYIAFFVANVPANFVIKQASGPLKQSGVALSEVTGSIWNGAGRVQLTQETQKMLPIDVNWQFQVWKLLLARLSIAYEIEGGGFKLAGGSSISPSTVTISEMRGQLSSVLINEFTKPQGVEISGLVELKDLNVGINFSEKRAERATGSIVWGGGEVIYRQGQHSERIDFPAIKGEFSENAGSLGLAVSDAKEGKVIAKAEVAPTGWAKVSVMKRVLELAGQMQVGEDGDKSVFEVQQKLF